MGSLYNLDPIQLLKVVVMDFLISKNLGLLCYKHQLVLYHKEYLLQDSKNAVCYRCCVIVTWIMRLCVLLSNIKSIGYCLLKLVVMAFCKLSCTAIHKTYCFILSPPDDLGLALVLVLKLITVNRSWIMRNYSLWLGWYLWIICEFLLKVFWE